MYEIHQDKESPMEGKKNPNVITEESLSDEEMLAELEDQPNPTLVPEFPPFPTPPSEVKPPPCPPPSMIQPSTPPPPYKEPPPPYVEPKIEKQPPVVMQPAAEFPQF